MLRIIRNCGALALIGKHHGAFVEGHEERNVTLIVQSAIPGSPGSISQAGFPEGYVPETEAQGAAF